MGLKACTAPTLRPKHIHPQCYKKAETLVMRVCLLDQSQFTSSNAAGVCMQCGTELNYSEGWRG